MLIVYFIGCIFTFTYIVHQDTSTFSDSVVCFASLALALVWPCILFIDVLINITKWLRKG